MANFQEFISISYSNIDFLILKDTVKTAFSCTEESISQLSKTIDFDKVALSLNQKIEETDTKKCILLNFSESSEENKQLALITSADCRVKQIKYKDFALFSDFYNECLKKKGILACSFLEDNFVSYLLDIEVFLHHLELTKL